MTALHSQIYKDAIERVIQRRLALGWSQEELARRLPRYERPGEPADEAQDGGQLQSYVSKFEQRQRRLDVTEFEHICHALGMTVAEAIEEHKWNGEPPPAFVPLARETPEEPPRKRRVKPGRRFGPRAASGKRASAPKPRRKTAAKAQPSTPAERDSSRPLDRAQQSAEAPGQEQQRAADSPDTAQPSQPARRTRPTNR